MKLACLSLILFAASALPACSGSTDDGGDPEVSAIERSERTAGAYRMASGEGNFLIRLTRTGNAVEGRALIETGNEGPGAPIMPVKGTVKSDGTHELTITFRLKGESLVPLIVKPEGDDLLGTIGEANDRQPARLARIKSDLEVPVVARFQDQAKIGSCELQMSGVELFGMRNATLESKLNDTFRRLADEGRDKCREEGVSGSVYLGALTKEVITYSSGLTVFGANDRVDNIVGARVNLSLVDGSTIGLWGDVLVPGKQSELGALIAARIDETPERAMPADKKPVFKDLMARRLAAGELEGDFFLGTSGVSFGVKDSPMVQVRAIMVPYEKLRPILAPNGKARSAWASR
jgi:hypothetical protein